MVLLPVIDMICWPPANKPQASPNNQASQGHGSRQSSLDAGRVGCRHGSGTAAPAGSHPAVRRAELARGRGAHAPSHGLRPRREENQTRLPQERQASEDARAEAKIGRIGRLFPHEATTLMVNSRGQPWTEDGFRASMWTLRKQLKAASRRDRRRPHCPRAPPHLWNPLEGTMLRPGHDCRHARAEGRRHGRPVRPRRRTGEEAGRRCREDQRTLVEQKCLTPPDKSV
jgi:hypothetical protein